MRFIKGFVDLLISTTLRSPFRAMATDIEAGKMVVFGKGDLAADTPLCPRHRAYGIAEDGNRGGTFFLGDPEAEGLPCTEKP